MKMKYFVPFVFLLLLSCTNDSATTTEDFSAKNTFESGVWEGSLSIHKKGNVSFYFTLDEDENMLIYNDEEPVPMEAFVWKEDSVTVDFKNYPNYLRFKRLDNRLMHGYFNNPDREENGKVEFTAEYQPHLDEIPDPMTGEGKEKSVENNVDGQWKTTFRADTDNPYLSVGKLQQTGDFVRGTFMTKSGDYRFLTGNLTQGKHLKLTSFDGLNPYLFIATLQEDSLVGTVYAGNHYSMKWKAERDDEFALSNPDSITYMVKDDFEVSFTTVEGEKFQYPNEELKGKVVIFQIMGTWCPNCLDETNYFKELYEKYQDKGLEIIGVAYETPETFEEQAARVQRYIKKQNIPYPLVLGGNVKDGKASEDFDMVNEITAYPTSFFLNREGKVAAIYTGFKGPGTREVYDEYVKKTNAFVEELLER